VEKEGDEPAHAPRSREENPSRTRVSESEYQEGDQEDHGHRQLEAENHPPPSQIEALARIVEATRLYDVLLLLALRLDPQRKVLFHEKADLLWAREINLGVFRLACAPLARLREKQFASLRIPIPSPLPERDRCG
jgi:hypothetical protein